MLKANRKWISYSVVMNTTSSSPSPFMQKTRHSVQLLDFSNIPEDKNIETKGTQNPAISYPCQSILFRWLLSRHTVSIHAYTWVWIIYVVWYYEGHTYSVKNGCSLRTEKIFFDFSSDPLYTINLSSAHFQVTLNCWIGIPTIYLST